MFLGPDHIAINRCGNSNYPPNLPKPLQYAHLAGTLAPSSASHWTKSQELLYLIANAMSHILYQIVAELRIMYSNLADSRWLQMWLFGLAIIFAFMSLIQTPVTRIPLGDPQSVDAAKAHVCVHTLLENEVDEWKIKRSLILAREMGASTIVQFFPWAYFEPDKNRYNWEQADLIVRHAENQGLQIIARLGLVPHWARPIANSTLNTLPEESFADFADYAAAFAARYAKQIQHIIIWNEPNLSFEWGYNRVDPAAYVRLLQVTYPGIKEANSAATVLAGALAPTNEARGSRAGLNEMDFLRDMYQSGGADYFDALAIHSYGFREAPESPPADDRLNFRRLELLREIMIANGDAQKRVFVTESGWNDHPRWTLAVRPSQRLVYTIGAFEFTEANWDWVDNLCIWALRYPAATNSYPDSFTLVSPEFDLKPIYYAIQNYARAWDRSASQWLPPPKED